ncbi:MAG TPA: HNH endonuclease signature motif containing protein [Rhizomicrobium sp.]|nr:HNH endonuclease signature motif containing protein [Rhizomicrobium sp.]
MAKLRMLGARIATIDTRAVKPPPKTVDPFYLMPEHVAWAAAVIAKAGMRCEWVENGRRCTKSAPEHRMFADHMKERRDGGAPFDPANGQCLCGSHHSLKTARERARRAAA